MSHVVSAENCLYRMSDGSQLIDCISGVYNTTYGHGHPVVVNSMKKHASLYACYKLEHPSRRELSSLLTQIVPHMKTWHFFTTGSEAVEKAIMSAIELKAQKGESRVTKNVVTLSGGFHGKTFGTAPYHYPQKLYHRPYNLIEVTKDDLSSERGIPDELDAVIVEPIRGWDGFAYEYWVLAKLREIAHKRGGIFISDETLTGFGRAGIPGFICGRKEVPIGYRMPPFAPTGNKKFDRGGPIMGRVDADILIGAKGMGQGAAKIVGVGFHEEMFPEDFEIEVGWWTTTAANPFDCSVARDITQYHLDNKMTELSSTIGAAFTQQFARTRERIATWEPRINGTLIYLTLGQHTKVAVKMLRNKHNIIVTDSTPQLRMSPAFTMEESLTQHVIDCIRSVCEPLGFIDKESK